jgi:hypothetical protein
MFVVCVPPTIRLSRLPAQIVFAARCPVPRNSAHVPSTPLIVLFQAATFHA